MKEGEGKALCREEECGKTTGQEKNSEKLEVGSYGSGEEDRSPRCSHEGQ